MSERVALVTGASGGLGTHVSRALVDAGYAVAGLARQAPALKPPHPAFLSLEADLSSVDSAEKAVEAVFARFQRIDVLAHLVGGFSGGKTIDETDEATWNQMFAANVTSAFHVFRAAVPLMRRTGGGRIIAIGARLAVEPAAKAGAYAASKAALVSLVRTLAAENKAAGITANVLLPGTMDTPANRQAMAGADFSRWVQPGSVASLVVWLGSEAGKDVSGAAIPVYGGG
ncbi:MAG TPA: SDR family NAD(P)-dependent oxidoreductase [Candidatus Acidoferrales bacterium]|nr:SDR family NAD(P)-dependent oxidoreductase [Candidatus Acidoferrales bacterium]